MTLDYSMMLTAPVRESLQCLNSVLNVKALVGAFNQEKQGVGRKIEYLRS